MQLSKKDYLYLSFIAIYCLVFLVIRLSSSVYAFSYDEAEQYIDAVDYKIGFKDQPPLFSWIIRTLSFAFGLNVPMMAVTSHVLIFLFFLAVYLSLRHFWKEYESLIILCTLLFFFIYSYDYYRYLVHTILMVTISAFSLLFYLRLLITRKTLYYILLGLFLGLGILAKYNFIFFILVLLLGSLSSDLARRRLFNLKSLALISSSLVVVLPHLLWLINNDFLPLHYTAQRGDSGGLNHNLGPVFAQFFWQLGLYLIVFWIFFAKEFSLKLEQNKEFFKLFRWFLAYLILVPLFVILTMKLGSFSQRWLAGINFLIPFALFSFIKFKSSHKVFLMSTIALIFGIYGMKVRAYYFPDSYKPIFIHKPYRAIYTQLEGKLSAHGLSMAETQFISYKEVSIIAAIKTFYKNTDILLFRNSTKLKLDPNKKQILIWAHNRFNRKKVNKRMSKSGYKISPLFILEAKYLHSKKLPSYKVSFEILEKV